MLARIYKPARTAMQSGTAKTKEWVLEYEPEAPRAVEPLMGWTSSSDMKRQVRLRFATREEAVAYAERHGIAYQLFEPQEPARRSMAYADNFAFHAPRAAGRISAAEFAPSTGFFLGVWDRNGGQNYLLNSRLMKFPWVLFAPKRAGRISLKLGGGTPCRAR